MMTLGVVVATNSSLITANAATTDELKDLTFPVTKYLTLPPDADGNPQQSQSYFSTPTTAQGGTPQASANQTKFPVITFILDVINLLVKIAGTLAVIMLIVTGIVMMVSMGNQNTTEKAKTMLGYTVLGIIIIFTSYVLVTFVQGIFTI